MSDLNSLWLKSFTVLCEERHFTRAAARLNMTQPGMSQHIAKLEQQLGVPLIERDAPGFALTDAGEKTLAMARARWREERDFLESLDDEDEDRGKAALTELFNEIKGKTMPVRIWRFPDRSIVFKPGTGHATQHDEASTF